MFIALIFEFQEIREQDVAILYVYGNELLFLSDDRVSIVRYSSLCEVELTRQRLITYSELQRKIVSSNMEEREDIEV